MTVKQAFYAVHGEDIQKLRASKQTVADTTRKAAGGIFFALWAHKLED